MHQQLSLPAPRRVGVEAGVGVREDAGEAAARPRYRPISVPSPGPGRGAHAVLAFTPPQPFSRDKTSSQAGRDGRWGWGSMLMCIMGSWDQDGVLLWTCSLGFQFPLETASCILECFPPIATNFPDAFFHLMWQVRRSL